MDAFRIVDAEFAAHAFDGEGARRAGGRWNSPRVPMVYTACHRSLAMLEMLIHLEYDDVLAGYWHIIPVTVKDDAIETARDIPSCFADNPAPPETRALGDAWIAANRSVGLLVPSAVVPGEFNLLLNPTHPDLLAAVATGKAEALRFDPRLTKGR